MTEREVTIPRPMLESQVITAMITPFHEHRGLNRKGAQELANYLLSHGSDGLVLAGTTGESPILTVGEQLDLFDVVREGVGEDVFLIGGTGSNNPEEAVELTSEADARGSVDALLVVSPYYNRPPQHGIGLYYEEIATETDLPLILYNIPVRTGKEVSLDTIRRLVDNGTVSALKDATGNTTMAEALNREFGDRLIIYSGDDGLNFDFATKAGAIGAISVMSHWAGTEMGQMFDALAEGEIERAARIRDALEPSVEFESVHQDSEGVYRDVPNPIPTKIMMQRLLGTEVIGNLMSPMICTDQDAQYLEERAVQIRTELAQAMARM